MQPDAGQLEETSTLPVEAKPLFEDDPSIELAFLFGSRVKQQATAHSDWDFGVRWVKGMSTEDRWVARERLRAGLARILGVTDEGIDIVDLAACGLAIKATLVAEGIPIKGKDTLPLARFYQRVWAEQEEFYWRLERDRRAVPG